MKNYTLNRIKSGRLMKERLDIIRPIEILDVTELKKGVEYDFYFSDRSRYYSGEFISLDGAAATFMFRRDSDRYDAPVGTIKTFGLISPKMWSSTKFVKAHESYNGKPNSVISDWNDLPFKD